MAVVRAALLLAFLVRPAGAARAAHVPDDVAPAPRTGRRSFPGARGDGGPQRLFGAAGGEPRWGELGARAPRAETWAHAGPAPRRLGAGSAAGQPPEGAPDGARLNAGSGRRHALFGGKKELVLGRRPRSQTWDDAESAAAQVARPGAGDDKQHVKQPQRGPGPTQAWVQDAAAELAPRRAGLGGGLIAGLRAGGLADKPGQMDLLLGRGFGLTPTWSAEDAGAGGGATPQQPVLEETEEERERPRAKAQQEEADEELQPEPAQEVEPEEVQQEPAEEVQPEPAASQQRPRAAEEVEVEEAQPELAEEVELEEVEPSAEVQPEPATSRHRPREQVEQPGPSRAQQEEEPPAQKEQPHQPHEHARRQPEVASEIEVESQMPKGDEMIEPQEKQPPVPERREDLEEVEGQAEQEEEEAGQEEQDGEHTPKETDDDGHQQDQKDQEVDHQDDQDEHHEDDQEEKEEQEEQDGQEEQADQAEQEEEEDEQEHQSPEQGQDREEDHQQTQEQQPQQQQQQHDEDQQAVQEEHEAPEEVGQEEQAAPEEVSGPPRGQIGAFSDSAPPTEKLDAASEEQSPPAPEELDAAPEEQSPPAPEELDAAPEEQSLPAPEELDAAPEEQSLPAPEEQLTPVADSSARKTAQADIDAVTEDLNRLHLSGAQLRGLRLSGAPRPGPTPPRGREAGPRQLFGAPPLAPAGGRIRRSVTWADQQPERVRRRSSSDAEQYRERRLRQQAEPEGRPPLGRVFGAELAQPPEGGRVRRSQTWSDPRPDGVGLDDEQPAGEGDAQTAAAEAFTQEPKRHNAMLDEMIQREIDALRSSRQKEEAQQAKLQEQKQRQEREAQWEREQAAQRARKDEARRRHEAEEREERRVEAEQLRQQFEQLQREQQRMREEQEVQADHERKVERLRGLHAPKSQRQGGAVWTQGLDSSAAKRRDERRGGRPSPVGRRLPHTHTWVDGGEDEPAQEAPDWSRFGAAAPRSTSWSDMVSNAPAKAPAGGAPMMRLGNCVVCRVGGTYQLNLFFVVRKAGMSADLEYLFFYNPFEWTWTGYDIIQAGQQCPPGHTMVAESVRDNAQACLSGSLWYMQRYSEPDGPWGFHNPE